MKICEAGDSKGTEGSPQASPQEMVQEHFRVLSVAAELVERALVLLDETVCGKAAAPHLDLGLYRLKAEMEALGVTPRSAQEKRDTPAFDRGHNL